MFRSKLGKWIRDIKSSNKRQQNMQNSISSHSPHSSSHNYFYGNLFVAIALKESNSLLFVRRNIFYDWKRTFSRSSNLSHEIKCVTNSYYEDLGLQTSATSKDIKDAYYRQESGKI